MPSQWLAVGAGMEPLKRARELQKSWERLLADGALSLELPPGATAGLRPTIVESWRRSLATGLDPTDSLAPIEADESEVLERWFEHPLGSLTHVLTEQLRKLAEDSRSVVVVAAFGLARLARRSRHVTSAEIYPDLQARAAKNLRAAGIGNVTLLEGDSAAATMAGKFF